MPPIHRSRVAFLVVAVVTAALAIAVRLYELQVVEAPALRVRAAQQHLQEREVQGRRGAILDRHGRDLAVSLETGSLYARPARLEDPALAARELASALGVRPREILRALSHDADFVWLYRNLDPDQLRRIRALDLLDRDDDALGIEREATRFYPGGSLAAHVVGFAGVDQAGLSGIERTRDAELQGDPGYELAFRDGLGSGFLEAVKPPSKTHRDVVLSIDAVLQHIVERELDRAMDETGAAAAWAILIDPSTGEILALANRPTPSLDRYRDSRPEEQRDRAALNEYEPGSTFKIVTAAAVLDRGVVTPSRRFDCENGAYRVADRTYTDHHPYGVMTFREIVEHSSNIGTIKAARLLAPRELLDYVRRFGFGSPTGFGLPEIAGRLPDLSSPSPVGPASLAIGYGLTVSGIQMASAFATIANGGVRVPPRIVLGTRDTDGGWHPEQRPRPERVLSARTARVLTEILRGVVEEGTAEKARVEGYAIAGKTGTARKHVTGRGYSRTAYYASFGGFAPADAPRISGLVVLDSPRGSMFYGGQTAAPTFARILEQALPYLRVPPDGDRTVPLPAPPPPKPPRVPLRRHRSPAG